MVSEPHFRMEWTLTSDKHRLLDTLTIIFDAHAVYFYLIVNYANPPALQKEIWCVLAFRSALTSLLSANLIISPTPGAHKYVFVCTQNHFTDLASGGTRLSCL